MNSLLNIKNKAFASKTLLFVVLISLTVFQSKAQGYLKTEGKFIVNDKGEKVILRGMGFGGWMLQEGYMLRFYNEGQQHKIKERFESVIGPEKTKEFYNLWLANNTRKIDIDSLKSWGFNSVRLPMHFNLYTLPIEQEPVKGQNTWLEKGFAMTDSLLSWCKANNMYLILDLHAAPGGQGNDLNISDRDPSKPSLWESEDNKNKTIALWRKLAERYANESWIGGYDIINEPNWGFQNANDKNGLNEQKNEPLRKLMMDITKAIREVDKNHIVIIEGNGWGNNYNGILPQWDDNMVLSFHKYWNYNNQKDIQGILDKREKYNLPIWLGETGENSNVWFTEAIRLAEANQIGWAWWPLKKMGFNNPLEIKMPEGYQDLLNYWSGKGDKPSEEAAAKTIMQLAENSKLENCIFHKDVIDAMFRQVNSSASIPFKNHTANNIIYAVDYDLGRSGVAYLDKDSANYYISTGGQRTAWNTGHAYRNDGVDVMVCNDETTIGYAVKGDSEEWLQYSVNVPKAGNYSLKVRTAASSDGAKINVLVNGKASGKEIALGSESKDWKSYELKGVKMNKGLNKIRIIFKGNSNLNYIQLVEK